VWADSHCHLPWDDGGDAEELLTAARRAGVTRLVTVGTDAAQSAAAMAFAARHEDVWATVGLHPHDAAHGVASIVPLLEPTRAGSDTVVAVGECGLDYHYDHAPRPVQRDAFAAQIALAHDHGLALVIHTREAWDDTFDILRATGPPPRTVFHCFTGGSAEARRALDFGAFLSFSGIVTFKGADNVRAAARECPLDRLLVETDSPYLAPAPHRGQKNQPAYVPLVGQAIAEVRGVASAVVEEATWRTTERVLLQPRVPSV
jgi:TatD DNase family protein